MKYILTILGLLVFYGCEIRDNGQPSESDIRKLVVLDLEEKLKNIDVQYRSVMRNGFYCWVSCCDRAGDKFLLTMEIEFNGEKYSNYVVMVNGHGGYNGVLNAVGKNDTGDAVSINIPIRAEYSRYQFLLGKDPYNN